MPRINGHRMPRLPPSSLLLTIAPAGLMLPLCPHPTPPHSTPPISAATCCVCLLCCCLAQSMPLSPCLFSSSPLPQPLFVLRLLSFYRFALFFCLLRSFCCPNTTTTTTCQLFNAGSRSRQARGSHRYTNTYTHTPSQTHTHTHSLAQTHSHTVRARGAAHIAVCRECRSLLS